MNGSTISDLPPIEFGSDVLIVAGDRQGNAGNMTMAQFAARMWDSVYIHAQAVIVQCRYCNSHNAVSNAACIQCGAPLGGTLK